MTSGAVVLRGGFTRAVDVRVLCLGREDIGTWAALLDETERLRGARFRIEADRDRFILGRGLLRVMVGEAVKRPPRTLSFRANAYGKPILEEAGRCAFNVAHSGDWVMVAVAEATAVGADVEKHRPDIDLLRLSERTFASREHRALAMAPEAERTAAFFRQWVLKEALLKGLGTGFSADPTGFEVTRSDPAEALARRDDGAWERLPGWEFHELAVADGYSAALALLP